MSLMIMMIVTMMIIMMMMSVAAAAHSIMYVIYCRPHCESESLPYHTIMVHRAMGMVHLHRSYHTPARC